MTGGQLLDFVQLLGNFFAPAVLVRLGLVLSLGWAWLVEVWCFRRFEG